MANTQTAPALSIGGVQLQYSIDVLDGLGVFVVGTQDGRYGVQRRNGPLVEVERTLIGKEGGFIVLELLGETA